MDNRNHNGPPSQSHTGDVDLMGAFTALFGLTLALGGIAALALWAFAGY